MVKGAVNPAILKAEKEARDAIFTEIAFGNPTMLKNQGGWNSYIPPRPFYPDMSRPVEEKYKMGYTRFRSDKAPPAWVDKAGRETVKYAQESDMEANAREL